MTEYSVTANWEFETGDRREAYMEWATQKLQRDFALNTSSEWTAVFLKRFRGDAESVRVVGVPSNGKLHVQVTDTICPD